MNKRALWAVVGFVVVAGFAYGMSTNQQSEPVKTGDVAGAAVAVVQEQEATAELVVAGTTGEIYRESVAFEEGVTVLDLMTDAGLELGTKEYSFGVAVEEINGVDQNDTEGKYWIFYVNGEMAQEGASTLVVNTGDVIEWRLE